MSNIEYTTFTNAGSREINEDSCGVAVFEDAYCFVVADGLGGHGGGDVASSCAVRVVCELFEKTGYSGHFFEEAFQSVQREIVAAQQQARTVSQMKTTMVILVVTSKHTYWAHVGDSRLYQWSGQKLKLHTMDHSVPQMLALSGEITEAEIRHHPDRNRLLRVMGVKGESPQFQCGKGARNHGVQTYLLCTDGYWELIEAAQMTSILDTRRPLEEWIMGMNRTIVQAGVGTEMDNYTAVAVRVCTKGLLGMI